MKTYLHFYHINSSYIINVGTYAKHIECLVIGRMQKKHGDLWFRRKIWCCQASPLWLKRWYQYSELKARSLLIPMLWNPCNGGKFKEHLPPKKKLTWHTMKTQPFFLMYSQAVQNGDFAIVMFFWRGVPWSELRPFWMDFLTKPFGVTWAEVAIICSKKTDSNTPNWCSTFSINSQYGVMLS